jgi:hypothetical protein
MTDVSPSWKEPEPVSTLKKEQMTEREGTQGTRMHMKRRPGVD